MYILAAEIVKTYAGDHRFFIENEIFARLNMTSTSFSVKKAAKSGRLSWTWDAFANRQIPFWLPEPEADVFSSAAGIISNVEDMVCYSSHHWLSSSFNPFPRPNG